MHSIHEDTKIKLLAFFVTVTLFVTRFDISKGLLMNGFLLFFCSCLWLLRHKLLQDSFAEMFVRTLFGFVFTSALYSIVQTHGNTISWGFFAVGAIFVSYRKYESIKTEPLPFKKYFLITKNFHY